MNAKDLTKEILKERMVLAWMRYNYDMGDSDMIVLEEIEKLVKEYEEKFGETKMLKFETQRKALNREHYVELQT